MTLPEHHSKYAETPPIILWSGIARLFVSPTRYRTVWLAHIADMHFERSECLKRGDRWGASWAVLRAHYYSLPSWLLRWALAISVAFILQPLRHWLAF